MIGTTPELNFFSPSPGSLPRGYFAIALSNPLSVKMVGNGIGFFQSTLVYPTPPVLQIHIRPPTIDELTYLHTYLRTYLLTYLLHGAEFFLRS